MTAHPNSLQFGSKFPIDVLISLINQINHQPLQLLIVSIITLETVILAIMHFRQMILSGAIIILNSNQI